LLPNEHLAALHLIDADISKYDFSRPSEVDDIGFCDIDVLLDRGWSKIEAEIAYRSLAEKGAIERGRIWDAISHDLYKWSEESSVHTKQKHWDEFVAKGKPRPHEINCWPAPEILCSGCYKAYYNQ